ncbi:DeoR/GlpR family DNA-binding transcription regulator [Oceanobacillus sp. CFH 90083]|uniref:DeoR/GlpR family DNA-binding transcription regulator n=1 Tax=Oceanobacillus sp. CFH 90083 TaxID=2592336 RepID=UPI00128D4151|nr:DeoR/GlpR family DNA-binding transcription regulator [Oceanobacillus sp. CFH 90083]
MMKAQRVTAILEYVKEKESVSLDELVDRFGVSKNTIRRDIQELVDEEQLVKVYGGVSISKPLTVPYQDRKVKQFHEKKTLAKLAAEFIEDGDIIFIDSGTTTVELLDFIKYKNITIVTNNLDFTLDASIYPNLNIYSTGGVFERSTRSYVGTESADVIQKYNFNKAFMASTGISLDKGITNSSPLETQVKSNVIKKSEQVFILVDHTKFNKYALTTYCSFEDIDYLITNQEPSQEYIKHSEQNQYELIYPR